MMVMVIAASLGAQSHNDGDGDGGKSGYTVTQ